MSQGTKQPDTYGVEVSGWNMDENFFVEQSELEWTESAHRISLRHAVRKGAFIFVRLLGTSESSVLREAVPVPYEVIRVEYVPDLRSYDTALLKIKPKTIADSQVQASNESTQGVLQ